MDSTAEPITLRQAQAVWVPIVIWVFFALALGDAIVEGSAGYAFRVTCGVALAAYIVYIALARPYLRIDDEGLTVANVLRTNRIPFAALTDIRVGGLAVVYARTADGGERKITSWNAPGVPRRPPRRSDISPMSGTNGGFGERRRSVTGESEVERLVRNRWDAWKRKTPQDQEPSVLERRWNLRTLAIALALIALNIAIRLR